MSSSTMHSNRRTGKSKPRRLPIVLWGALLLMLALGTTLPLMHKANRSLLMEMGGSPTYKSLKHRFLAQSKPQPQGPINIDDGENGADDGDHDDDDDNNDDDGDDDDDDDLPNGIRSKKPASFFRTVQQTIDQADLTERCARYGLGMTPKPNSTEPAFPQRRIFYGSLIANEPWELLEIVAAETYGIFSGMVFVESNRTQNAVPRPFRRTEKHIDRISAMFGIPSEQFQLRRYINEDTLENLEPLAREHRQRHEILKGWKDLGMGPNDIGYIADADETFTRDFLRAVQTCPYVEALDYDTHHCFNPLVKIAGYTRMYEASPECITKARTWYHPDMILGACVELIGNETLNPMAPRKRDYLRANGYAHNCETKTEALYNNSFGNIDGDKYPLWSAADFRRQCGGRNYELNATNMQKHTAYHFHNFFADFTALRNKYKNYGHPVQGALRKRLEHIGDDLKMMVRCVQNWTDAPPSKTSNLITETQQWQREIAGFEMSQHPLPIYFLDPEYRKVKHMEVKRSVEKDERLRQKRLALPEHEIEALAMIEEAKELKRKSWQKESEAQAVRERYATKETDEVA